mgnify:CR=1 FL=1
MEHILGYLAASINLVAMGMKNILFLRILSLTANTLFIAYGIQLQSTPIAWSCSIAALIHIYHLTKMYRESHTTHSKQRALM